MSFVRFPSEQKKCLLEELHQFDFFADLLIDLGSEVALYLP